MAGVRKKPTKGGLWQAWFIDAAGKKHFFTARSKTEARRMAERLEDEQRQVRLGYRPAPLSAEKHSKRPFVEATDEYLAWGESQGGRGGRPWSTPHARNRRTGLDWWQETLGLATLADLDGILPRAEKALRNLLSAGKTGKTLSNYAEALRAFCQWCRQRGYLNHQPLEGLAPFDITPNRVRRALSVEEINRFLSACTPSLRLLYDAAFLSGLRVNELRSLTVDHLDRERSGLILDAEWTKNRQAGFQPLSKALVARLSASVEAGEPDRLYAQAYALARHRKPAPEGRLLYVPWHTAQAVYADLERAGIPKWTSQGVVDFHALRNAYITLVTETDATLKEAQTLARHSDPKLTMNIYARTRPNRLAETVEKIAERLPTGEKVVPGLYRQAVGAETESATPFETKGVALIKSGGGSRIRTYEGYAGRFTVCSS